jgi:hypothetical protein
MHCHVTPLVADPDPSDFIRLPGLFRRWELPQVIDLEAEFQFEEAGLAADGTRLIAIYRRERSRT